MSTLEAYSILNYSIKRLILKVIFYFEAIFNGKITIFEKKNKK